MLRYLAEWATQFHSGFNVFSYLTLRAILAALTALAISFVVGPYVIRRLAHHQVAQAKPEATALIHRPGRERRGPAPQAPRTSAPTRSRATPSTSCSRS